MPQVGGPVRVAERHAGQAAVVVAQRDELGGPHALGHGERLLHQRQSGLLAVEQYVERADVHPGERVPRGVAVGLDECEGPSGRRPRVGGTLGCPLLAGQDDQPVRQSPLVTDRLPQPDGLLGLVGRRALLVEVVQRPRPRLGEDGAPDGGQQVSAPQDLGTARRSLSVGARIGGLLRRSGPVADDGLVVARPDRVVEHAGRGPVGAPRAARSALGLAAAC